MKLEFSVDQRDQFWTVHVWYSTPDGQMAIEGGREHLHESQYANIADWCSNIFDTKNSPRRARRMSYDCFWFTSKRDLDWFILHWSGVDSEAV